MEEIELREKLHQTLDNMDSLIARLPKTDVADGLKADLSELRQILVQWRRASRDDLARR